MVSMIPLTITDIGKIGSMANLAEILEGVSKTVFIPWKNKSEKKLNFLLSTNAFECTFEEISCVE